MLAYDLMLQKLENRVSNSNLTPLKVCEALTVIGFGAVSDAGLAAGGGNQPH
jgi:hypothetical protein